jgi:hypothetical protein
VTAELSRSGHPLPGRKSRDCFQPYGRRMRVLFVCTGNLCRSPIPDPRSPIPDPRSPVAGRLAAAWAREALGDSPELAQVEILSAGEEADAGQAIARRAPGRSDSWAGIRRASAADRSRRNWPTAPTWC